MVIVNYLKEGLAQSKLIIDHVKLKDRGNYHCVSQNKTIAKFKVYIKPTLDPRMSQDQAVNGVYFPSTPTADSSPQKMPPGKCLLT